MEPDVTINVYLTTLDVRMSYGQNFGLIQNYLPRKKTHAKLQ